MQQENLSMAPSPIPDFLDKAVESEISGSGIPPLGTVLEEPKLRTDLTSEGAAQAVIDCEGVSVMPDVSLISVEKVETTITPVTTPQTGEPLECAATFEESPSLPQVPIHTDVLESRSQGSEETAEPESRAFIVAEHLQLQSVACHPSDKTACRSPKNNLESSHTRTDLPKNPPSPLLVETNKNPKKRSSTEPDPSSLDGDPALSQKRKRIWPRPIHLSCETSPKNDHARDSPKEPASKMPAPCKAPLIKRVGGIHPIYQSDLDRLNRLGSHVDVRVLNAACHVTSPKLDRSNQTGLLPPELILNCQPDHPAVRNVRKDFFQGKTIVQPLYDKKRKHFVTLIGNRKGGVSLYDSLGWTPNDLVKLQVWTLCGDEKDLRIWTPSVPSQAAGSNNCAVYACAFAVDAVLRSEAITTANYGDERLFRLWLRDLILKETVTRPKRRDTGGSSMTRPGRASVMVSPEDIQRYRVELGFPSKPDPMEKKDPPIRHGLSGESTSISMAKRVQLPGSPISDAESEITKSPTKTSSKKRKDPVEARDIFFPSKQHKTSSAIKDQPPLNMHCHIPETTAVPGYTSQKLDRTPIATTSSTKRKSCSPRKRQTTVADVWKEVCDGPPKISSSPNSHQPGASSLDTAPDGPSQVLGEPPAVLDLPATFPECKESLSENQTNVAHPTSAALRLNKEPLGFSEVMDMSNPKDNGQREIQQGSEITFERSRKETKEKERTDAKSVDEERERIAVGIAGCPPKTNSVLPNRESSCSVTLNVALQGKSEDQSNGKMFRQEDVADHFLHSVGLETPAQPTVSKASGQPSGNKSKASRNADRRKTKKTRFSTAGSIPDIVSEEKPAQTLVEVREPDSTSSLSHLIAEPSPCSPAVSTTLPRDNGPLLPSKMACPINLAVIPAKLNAVTRSTNTDSSLGPEEPVSPTTTERRPRRSRRGFQRDAMLQCDALGIMKSRETQTDELNLEELIASTFTKVEIGLASHSSSVVTKTRKHLSGILLRAEELLNGHLSQDDDAGAMGSPVDLLDTLDLLDPGLESLLK